MSILKYTSSVIPHDPAARFDMQFPAVHVTLCHTVATMHVSQLSDTNATVNELYLTLISHTNADVMPKLIWSMFNKMGRS